MRARKGVFKSTQYLFAGLLLVLFALALTFASTKATQAMTSHNASGTTSISGSVPLATNTPACGIAWRGANSPLPPGVSELDGVAGVSASDVWAVGLAADNDITQTLTMHWDGAIWSIVPSPNGSGPNSWLSAVAAHAANDVWAVGGAGTADVSQTLIEHWDGSTWSIVPSPNPDPPGINVLCGIALAGTNDVWAVGYYGSTPTYRNLTEHWDGNAWSVIPSPNDGTGDNLLHAVTATGPSDVWAVGTHYQTNISFYRTTTMHWNGSGWTIYTSPPSYGHNYFFGVLAVSPNDVWAVGGEEDMIAHWNGTSWGGAGPVVLGDLHGVSGSAQNDVWAVGNITASGYYPIYHYDGSHWWNIPSNSGSYLQAVAALSRNDAWAVGYDDNHHVLVEHYNDPCATPTPTSTPSRTATGTPPTSTATPSRTSTRTPTAAPSTTNTAVTTPTHTPTNTLISTNTPNNTSTNTPTGTSQSMVTITPTPTVSSTVCSIQFPDVPSGSTFYSYVRCLACMGIVNGYGDGSFRPGSSVTRGQLSKIVANAAGFNETETTHRYEDVTVGSTFQVYIGRLASRGYISGYPCGGPGEPCVPPGNLPYFRPTGKATRGQISKIVSEAAEFQEPPTGQTFEDIPLGSTLYTYTQRLASRGIMSGYQCGNLEPCVPPNNRPYFRPANNVTRGQTTKIVGNSFFPICQSANLP